MNLHPSHSFLARPRRLAAVSGALLLLAAIPAARAGETAPANPSDSAPQFIPTMFGNAKGTWQAENGIPASRGPYKVAEGDSPYPQDRVYVHYNYFSGMRAPFKTIQRETIGVEKTFFEEKVSLGLRLPFFQSEYTGAGHPPAVSEDYVGNLTILLKAALWRKPESVLSAGLVIVPPTGEQPYGYDLDDNDTPGFFSDDRVTGESHSTLLEPFVGYGYFWKHFFVHGFSSVLVPTDYDQDVTVLFNDLGVGWRQPVKWGLVRELAPVFEVHVNTPLTERDRFVDSVDLTWGLHVVFSNNSSLGIGVGTCVTEPQLFDIEGLVNFNWRF